MKYAASDGFRGEWFLLLVPAFFSLNGLVRFPSALLWSDALLIFLSRSAWSLVIVFLFGFFFSFRKAALLGTALMIYNCAYGAMQQGLSTAISPVVARFSWMLILLISVVVVAFVYLKRTDSSFNRLTQYLNLVCSVLFFIEIVRFLSSTSIVSDTAIVKPPDKAMPDIWLVVTDGYAGKEQMLNQLNFNNQPFLDSLRYQGFNVLDRSFSNYASTASSMATLLNMNYTAVDERADVHQYFNECRVVQTFKAFGYQIVNNSPFRLSGQMPKHPLSYFPTGPELITRHSFATHCFSVVHNEMMAMGVLWEQQRVERVKREQVAHERQRDSMVMKELTQIASDSSTQPRFIYTHFLMPHPPYLFAKNGEPLTSEGSVVERYTAYIPYVNQQLLKAVRSILNVSKRPSVIILLSDHGFRNDDDITPTSGRYSNLVAIYDSRIVYQSASAALSNVNRFRVLFNEQFGQQLPLLREETK